MDVRRCGWWQGCPANTVEAYWGRVTPTAQGGFIEEILDANGQQATVEYDQYGRLVGEPAPAPYGLRLDTTYTHDGFGNVTTTTINSPAQGIAAIAPRTATNTYDGQGRFATSAANALNHSETRAFDARFGGATSLTGPNGLTTQWQYDGFGRKILEIRADGTRTKIDYLYCSGTHGGTEACPAGAKFLSRTIPRASDGTTQNGPMQTTFFDGLGREMGARTQGFDGTPIWSTRQYDALGRQTHQSRPYFEGAAPVWIVQQHDVLGRVTLRTEADNSTTTLGYRGLVTSTTNSLGQTRTETRNSQGWIVQVQDAKGGLTRFWHDPVGNVAKTQDAAGNVTLIEFDTRGRKVAMTDPNMGTWKYAYDALGQLVSQTDAKDQISTLTYDKLGRITGRTESDQTSTWAYDTAAYGIGKLTSTSTTAGYMRQHAYDALGRHVQSSVIIDGNTSSVATTYDTHSRIATVAYPSGFTVRHAYTGLGYLSEVRNDSTNALYWRADTINAEGQLTAQTQGNGVPTSQNYNNLTGRLNSIAAGASGAVASFTYMWDTVGNLQWRKDANHTLEEIFQYDELNRLTQAGLEGGSTKTYQYDSIGNITYKSDVGTYSYPAPGAARPNAVASIAGTTNTTFTYDANGNMQAGNGRMVTWTSFNMPDTIKRGTETISFTYDTDHGRIKQVTSSGTTTYVNDPGSGVRVEKLAGTGGLVQWKNYIYAAGKMVAVFFENNVGGGQTRYFHTDHLGSIVAITNEVGAILERLSYDAWGKRRYPNGTDDPTGAITSQVDRGFTGHEQLEEVGLVHMNGRVYDPDTGRFLSADPNIQDASDSQGFNRYSYVNNNPLAYTDPSGFFLKGLGKFFKKIWKPLVAIVAAAVVFWVLAPLAMGVAVAQFSAVQAVAAGMASGLVSSAITSGFDPQSMFMGALAGGMFAAVGQMGLSQVDPITMDNIPSGFTDAVGGALPAYAIKTVAHAGIGGLMSTGQGGKFLRGALSAGFSKALAPFTAQNLGPVGSTVANAVIGGTASVIGGGKFANGAFTAAFAHIVNQLTGEKARHNLGVEEAMRLYERRGYEIVTDQEVAVNIPGFDTPRRYDFIARDPAANINIGVEVKTTIFDRIFLKPDQVAKDLGIFQYGGGTTNTGVLVQGVGYVGYCFGCGMLDWRGVQLRNTLRAAGIPMQHGRMPGEARP